MAKGPLARTGELLTKEVDGELLVYSEDEDVACKLNRTAVLVWQNCNGKRSVADLVGILTHELGEIADENMVLMALDTLADHGLIASGYERRDERASRLSRRLFFKRVGVVSGAAMAAPVVYTMAVPSPAAATNSYNSTTYMSTYGVAPP